VRFQIRHLTRYVYSRPVLLEPHTIRLRPRCDATQKVLRFEIEVHPEPVGIAAGIDAEGNPFEQVWFDGLWDRIEIGTVAEVETLRTNPFDFLLMEESRRLPLELDAFTRGVLGPCLPYGSAPASEGEDSVRVLTDRILDESGWNTIPFLNSLNDTLFRTIRRVVRKEPGVFDPATTIENGCGACRDMALLFMDVCRRVGIPARFVSGYQGVGAEPDEQELHAWVEVFLPGGGWRGYDPTEGLAVQDHHVALASSAHPSLTAPVCGTFRGTESTSSLETCVNIEIR
jgi:transglutaminase-like putative cysteine protease